MPHGDGGMMMMMVGWYTLARHPKEQMNIIWTICTRDRVLRWGIFENPICLFGHYKPRLGMSGRCWCFGCFAAKCHCYVVLPHKSIIGDISVHTVVFIIFYLFISIFKGVS